MSGLKAALQEIFGEKIFRHAVEMDSTLLVKKLATFLKGADLSPYDTGWINCSDWTNRHLGSDTTLNTDSNVTHNLNAPLSNLLVKLFISTDGTDANSFEIHFSDTTGSGSYGFTVYQVDANNIKVQTATNGLTLTQDDGTVIAIDTENWYYKVKVWFLG